MTRHDTRTGESLYKADPLPDQQIQSLLYVKPTNSLLAGTTMHADCHSCTPSSDLCYFARLDAGTLSLLDRAPAPKGTHRACVLGPMGKGTGLCLCFGNFTDGIPWFVLDVGAFSVPALEAMERLSKEARQIVATGKPGFFVLHIKERLELWDMRAGRCVDVLCRHFDGYRFEAQDDSLYIVKPRQITILDGCLKGLK